MSITREKRKAGYAYRVRWWDDSQKKRSRTFNLKRDAEAFEAKVKLAKRRGDLADLDAGKQKLQAFVDEWWRLFAEPRLTPKTRGMYASLRDRYIVPELGSFELRRLTPTTIQRFQADLVAEGVGQETIRKTLALLQGMLERAVEWGRLQVNPVRVIKKPPQGRRRAVRAIPPSTIEQLRTRLRERDSALVSVLAYAGLRPGEALALTWGDIRGDTIVVEKALSQGEVQDTKTRRSRVVKMLRPLVADLKAWRLAAGRPADDRPVFPMKDGRFWSDNAYRNWRSRVFAPAAKALGLNNARPYDLRHSLASLLFAEGRNPAEIAEMMGHSIETLLGTYVGVIEELRGKPRESAEELIRVARGPQMDRSASRSEEL